MFKKSKYFIVTGATGFVGSYITKELIKKNYNVIILVKNIKKAKKIFNKKKVKIILFNIKNLTENFDIPKNSILIHTAWINVRKINSNDHLKINYPKSYLFIKNCINKGLKDVLVIGSCYEYGLKYGPITASTKTKPNSKYAIAKDKLHKSLRLLQNKKKFNLIWCRLFYLFGDGQDKHSIISKLNIALFEKKKVFNMSLGEQLLDYLHVKIAVKKIINLLKKREGIFNVCSGKPISLRRLIEETLLRKKKKIKLNLGYYKYRKNDSLAIWGN
jgi:nucleoside-diphosphate-sugar epimerase